MTAEAVQGSLYQMDCAGPLVNWIVIVPAFV